MKLLFIFFSALLLTACNNSAPPATGDGDSLSEDGTDVNRQAADSIDTLANMGVATPSPEGVYQAYVSGDGGTVEHTVAFYPDLSYRLEEAPAGGRSKPAVYTGNWKHNNGLIDLMQGAKVLKRYTWSRDTLLLPLGGKNIPLTHRMSAENNATWKAKAAAGTEFFGVGNEPFWNVEVDEQKGIAFHLAEWPAPKKFPAAQPVVSPDSTVYTTSTDSASLSITIYPRFCSDGMSDFIYSREVRVRYKKQVYSGCGVPFKK